MKGPESEIFKKKKPDEKIVMQGDAPQPEAERPSADGIKVEEGEAIEMEGTAEEQAARAELQRALDNTGVTDHGKAEVIEMKGHAPNTQTNESKNVDHEKAEVVEMKGPAPNVETHKDKDEDADRSGKRQVA